METTSISINEINRDWYIVKADNHTLGRLASEIAQILRGKKKPFFTPHMDMGDFVIIVNADKVILSGKKASTKDYFKHTNYPGGAKNISIKVMKEKKPEFILMNSVKGMLPHNRLGKKILTHLKVYAGSEHPHSSQKPIKLEL